MSASTERDRAELAASHDMLPNKGLIGPSARPSARAEKSPMPTLHRDHQAINRFMKCNLREFYFVARKHPFPPSCPLCIRAVPSLRKKRIH